MNICPVCTKETLSTYCSLSCSNISRTAKNEIKYLLNPKTCKRCNTVIPYNKRWDSTYCSRSCAAIGNHNKPRKQLKTQREDRSPHTQALKRFAAGELKKRRTIRIVLNETVGPSCSKCNLPPIWCGEPLVMVVDHIDGNAGNNLPSNLRLLCPNCTSQTSTFCGRNIGNGRQSHGMSKSA